MPGGLNLFNKYKLIVLILIVIAVMAILFFSYLPSLTPGEEEETAPADSEFQPADDPYAAYNLSLDAEKPIVLKFYARW